VQIWLCRGEWLVDVLIGSWAGLRIGLFHGSIETSAAGQAMQGWVKSGDEFGQSEGSSALRLICGYKTEAQSLIMRFKKIQTTHTLR